MSEDKQEYYVLKCPYCDGNITKVMERPNSIVICPNCNKELNLYTIFGYNMWLSENGKSKKVGRRPIKDIKKDRKTKIEEKYNFELDEESYDNSEIFEECINQSVLMNKEFKNLKEILAFNADVCVMQYIYLLQDGFTRPEAIEIIGKLIDQNFLL